jgi:hypothetical protein
MAQSNSPTYTGENRYLGRLAPCFSAMAALWNCRKTPSSATRLAVKQTVKNYDSFKEGEIELLLRIRALPEHRRYLITEIVEQFAFEQEMWHD